MQGSDILLIGPLMYPILYSFMYNAEATTDVKMVVVDPCNSKESREFRRKMDATQDVKDCRRLRQLERG